MTQETTISLPIARNDEETLQERLTDNAYNKILPGRYLKKDENGDVIEAQEELFPRVARNVALAELVYADETVYITTGHIKPDHPRREELLEEVFGEPSVEEVPLTEDNAKHVSYDAVYPDLDEDLQDRVDTWANTFMEAMEHLRFMPNTPSLINAGNELQQLSACFVMSPDDDMEHIHETAKRAALTFQSGGGCGYSFSKLRPYGDTVGSTGGIASGPITFMETFDQMCQTIAQGGARRGAQMGVMRVDHPDVIHFIHAKNKDTSLAHVLRLDDPKDYVNNGFGEALDEARSLIDGEQVPAHLRNAAEGFLSNFNISVGVTDDFMEALENGEDYTFINPRTEEPHVATPETAEMYGWFGLGEYVEAGEVLSIPAEKIWERIVEGAHENGEPGVIYIDRINQKHSFDTEKYPEHEIISTNPCVTGDTLISTDNGLISAEELYKQGTATDVVVDGRISEEPVKEASSVYKTGEKDVYQLKTKEGFSLRLTADHRVMTDSGWVEAQELEENDIVHIQNRCGGFGQYGSEKEGQVLGWLVGDGHLKHDEGRAVLNFYDDDSELSETFASHVNDVVREPLGNGDYEVGVSTIERSDDYRGSQAIEQRVRSMRLYEMAERIGLCDTKLQVPDVVMQGSKEMARGFLSALFTADGSVQGTKRKGYSVRLGTVSEDLAEGVQQLLLNFGIKSTVYYDRNTGNVSELPDGKGGTKEYQTQDRHAVAITAKNMVRFHHEIGFLRSDKEEALQSVLDEYQKGPYEKPLTATVELVEPDGHEAVYDLTEPDTESFIGNGIVIHNCSEQPLENFEACNLGHINLSTIVDENRTLWQNFDGDVDEFVTQAIDWPELNERIEYGTRFLDNVVTMSNFPIPEIEEKVSRMRKVGLGVMGLAQMFIQIGIEYGSEEGNRVTETIMTHINHRSKQVSHQLAQERGTFAEYEESKYANPTEYEEWFLQHVGQDPEEWSEGFPIRNHNLTTVAPTGTTSMVSNTSGGIEPIYNVAHYKNVSNDLQGDEQLVEFDSFFLRTLKENDIDVDAAKAEAAELMNNNAFDGPESLSMVPDELAELFITTSDLSGREHASVMCAAQTGTDSAISKTCNFPHEATVEDMDEVYRYIYENGGKSVTVYRSGSRSKQVLSTNADHKESEEEETDVETLVEEEFGVDYDTLKALATTVQGAQGSLESEEEEEKEKAVADGGTDTCDECGNEIQYKEGCQTCPCGASSKCEI